MFEKTIKTYNQEDKKILSNSLSPKNFFNSRDLLNSDKNLKLEFYFIFNYKNYWNKIFLLNHNLFE